MTPDRAEAWAFQIMGQLEGSALGSLSQRRDQLEVLRGRLIASIDTSAGHKPPELNAPSLIDESIKPSLGWHWQPHQLQPRRLWPRIRSEAQAVVDKEHVLVTLYLRQLLAQNSMTSAMADVLSRKLATASLPADALFALFKEAYASEPKLEEAMATDFNAVFDRDPACEQYMQVINFKGFQALQAYRVAHLMWGNGRKALATTIQARMSECFHVDIHPAAQLGWGIMLDHATGIVIGETAVLGDNVSMLHHVTLGGSGTGSGIRHPTVGHGVLLGAGVSVLGPIMIGAGSKVGAGSVVTRDLPCHCVAVGVPARIVKYDLWAEPVQMMDQCLHLITDYEI